MVLLKYLSVVACLLLIQHGLCLRTVVRFMTFILHCATQGLVMCKFPSELFIIKLNNKTQLEKGKRTRKCFDRIIFIYSVLFYLLEHCEIYAHVRY